CARVRGVNIHYFDYW
nr:immunoglobulin heavy chain junction region [Macaca mulatta]MOX62150.1 immunoglobulin heavy chain junction region [Macaca mulatta]MOX63238.1 immunoglobulin heavy chain junction region [Macaca mulatta]MOX65039.1 immunoglobulin heavy chain junction region [Macaca mulatta]MOX65385.1 immunoglobulin heavy chain junction region [Macaca mulatta]